MIDSGKIIYKQQYNLPKNFHQIDDYDNKIRAFNTFKSLNILAKKILSIKKQKLRIIFQIIILCILYSDILPVNNFSYIFFPELIIFKHKSSDVIKFSIFFITSTWCLLLKFVSQYLYIL